MVTTWNELVAATDAIRQRIVTAAAGELGPGDPPKYWRSCRVPGPPYPKHWCGGFALWALHEAQVGLDVSWRIGLGFCEVERLPRTTRPKPGDVAYKDKPFQHHAVVERVDGDTVTTIDGNQPHCARRVKKLSAWTCFYSVESLIKRSPLGTANTEQAPSPSAPPHERRKLVLTVPPMRGPDVLECRAILGLGDGAYDTDAWDAVKLFQAAHGLTIDGVVGAIQTWPALLKEPR